VAKVRAHSRYPSSDGGCRQALRSHRGDPCLEVVRAGVSDGAARVRTERGEIALVRVDGAWRPACLKGEQEALDVGVGACHGARRDSAGRRRLLRALAVLAAVLCIWAVAPAAASASQLIARNTSSERLTVSSDGKALLTYHAQGKRQRVLVWGAMNARPPSQSAKATEFRVDYSGGWGTFRRQLWKTHRNVCGPYRGPALPFLVTACTAPDGSHWAIQRWRRHQPNFGIPPWKPGHGSWELRVSHWSGEVAKLEAWLDWSYAGRWHHLFGRLTYRGLPVHGFSTTPTGDPLDRYGRVLYLDTLDSAYGKGWYRENGFVARRPDGTFCYGFVPHTTHSGERRPAGHGARYRLAVSGPGVTPDVVWESAGLANYDPENATHVGHETAMNALQRSLMARSTVCRT